MANNIAANRLRKELAKLKKDPPPGIVAEPKESDILTWFYALQGPPETPYEGGVYVGKLKFPSEYPMKPPSIMMLTPSGRFEVNRRLCMSMSDFHPESWNPMWAVGTILQGVISFMTSEELTTGGIQAPDGERKRLAGLSKTYNAKNFSDLFEGDMDAAFAEAEKARKVSEKAASASAASASTRGVGGRRRVGPKKDQQNSKDKDNDQEIKVNEQGSENEDNPGQREDAEEEPNPEEVEKRRKKNAKKRAKQKAKKAAAKAGVNNEDISAEDD